MGQRVGRIVNAEAPPEGRWWRVHLDTGATIYADGDRLARLVEHFGDRLPEAVFRFETNAFRDQVQRVEVATQPAGWTMTLPFHPDPARTMDPPQEQERLMLMALVKAIPEGPITNGTDASMQRAKRMALGILASTLEAPYQPDPTDAEDFFRFLSGKPPVDHW